MRLWQCVKIFLLHKSVFLCLGGKKLWDREAHLLRMELSFSLLTSKKLAPQFLSTYLPTHPSLYVCPCEINHFFWVSGSPSWLRLSHWWSLIISQMAKAQLGDPDSELGYCLGLFFVFKTHQGDFDRQSVIGSTALKPSYSACGPSNISIVSEIVRNAEAQNSSEKCGIRISTLTNASGDCMHIEFEMHCFRSLPSFPILCI